MAKARFRGLVDTLKAIRPEIDAVTAISDGRVIVDGRVIDNPNARVRTDASVVVRATNELRGMPKLRAALEVFDVDPRDRIALDVGASTGGFTRVLLDAGAARVYAVDAGHGQLLGSLRQDERVVNLESTNLGELSLELVPDAIDVFTVDLSYLSLTDAVPQLEQTRVADAADLIALVKPMFELGLDTPPTDDVRLQEAVDRAADGIERGPWQVVGRTASPIRGSNGAVEFLIHARRR